MEDDDRCEQEFERDEEQALHDEDDHDEDDLVPEEWVEEQALHDDDLVPEEWDDLEVPGLEPVT